MRARPVADVPTWVKALLAGAFALQLGFAAVQPPPRAVAEDLGMPPGEAALRLAGFGEPIALAKLLMLYVQAFDYQAGTHVPYRNLDYAHVEAWLAAILALDPDGQ